MGKVARYEGIASLVTAGEDVLSDSTIDAAVIHGLGEQVAALTGAISSHTFYWRDLGTENPELATLVEDTIPEISTLSGMVERWWANQPSIAGYTISPHLANAWIRSRPIPPHFDVLSDEMAIDGPLTFSLRLDNRIDHLRTFRAKRYTGLMTLATPPDQLEPIVERQKGLAARAAKRRFNGLVRILQDPGDMVLFMNHPEPTLHAVSTEKDATTSLIGSYAIYPPGVSPPARDDIGTERFANTN